MLTTVVISAIACFSVILLILLCPSVKIKGRSFSVYWLPALIAAIILMSVENVDFDYVISGFTQNTAVNPLKILVLFISMTLLSIYLDEVGFFRYLASVTLKHAGNNGIALFTVLYFMVAALTVVTSNDIIVLTFSPFICYFAKNAAIDPLPYLIGEFVSANTWSMALIIGNPTNIFLASGAGIDFAHYFTVMALPTVFAGLTAYAVLLLLFGKRLKSEIINGKTVTVPIEDKSALIIGLVHLIGCTALLAVASYMNWEMWEICLGFALSLFFCIALMRFIHKKVPEELIKCLKRAPWELIPFVLSMFVIVLALDQNGVCSALSQILSKGESIINYGLGTFITSNIINNIPASVFMNSILSSFERVLEAEVFAAVIGTNIGAFLTPVGALAGIMWSGTLARAGIKLSFLRFVLIGIIISIPTLFAALGGLYISMLF